MYNCKTCEVNWAQLHSQTEADETYDFCPNCKSDLDLQHSDDPDTYLMSPVTGVITSTITGKLLNLNKVPVNYPIELSTGKTYQDFVDEKIERERKEDEIIEFYRKQFV